MICRSVFVLEIELDYVFEFINALTILYLFFCSLIKVPSQEHNLWATKGPFKIRRNDFSPWSGKKI